MRGTISETGDRPAPSTPQRQQTLTLIAMCLALAITVLDDTMVNVALPSLQTSLSLSVSGLRWVVNAYLLAITCLVLPAGTLGDLYGRRRVFLAGLAGFVGASVLVGMSISGPMVIAARLLQGVSAAALLPTTLAILADAFPDPKERAKVIGLWSGVSGLALVAGPALGGLLVETWGWRSIFFINLPLGLVTFGLMQQIVPVKNRARRSHQAASPQLDLPGIVLSAVALAAFITLLMGAKGLAAAGLGLLGMGSAITFVVTESVTAWPMLPLKLFGKPAFATAVVTNALLFFMLMSLLFLFSLFLQQVQGYSAIATGLRFLPLNAAFVFASIISGYVSVRLGQRYAITLGFLLAAVAVLSLSQIQPETPYGSIVWKLSLVGFSVGFTLSPLTAAGMGSLPASRSGMAAALMNTSTRLGGALGIAVQGSLLAQGMGGFLRQAIASTNLTTGDQTAVTAEILAYGTTRPDRLSPLLADGGTSFAEIEQVAHEAFVAGLQSVLLAAAIALLMGAGLSFAYIRRE